MRRRGRDGFGRVAVCLYAAAIPFQPVLTMADDSALRIAAADLVAPLVFLAAWLAPRRRLPAGPALLVIAIPVVALFSTLLAAHGRSLTGYAVGKSLGLVYLSGLALAATRALARGREALVLRALATGVLWSAGIGLVGFAAYWVGHVDTTLVDGGRLCATMPGDPNIFASLVAVALLIVVADRGLAPGRRAASLAVLGAALLATGSRSGVAGGLVAGAVYGLARSRDPWVTAVRGVYGLLALVLGASAVLLSPLGADAGQMLWEHLWRTWTVESRFDLYARAWEQFADHPVFGLGIGGFHELNTWQVGGYGQHYAVHNTYLWALVDLGIVGGVLLPALIATGIGRALRAVRGRTPVPQAAAIAAALAAMAAFNLFVDGFYQRHFWLLLSCALGLPLAATTRPRVTWAWHRAVAPSLMVPR